MPQTRTTVTEVSRTQEWLLGVLGSLDSASKRLSFLRTILEIADRREVKVFDALEARSFLYGAVAALDPAVAASLAKRHFPFGSGRPSQKLSSLTSQSLCLNGLKSASDDLLKLVMSEAAKSPKRYQRPLQGSRARTNARARNYSARSVKRKRLSGSPVSSRKHSSTG
jgi:hypothetical protein